jgi:hypothetical protein
VVTEREVGLKNVVTVLFGPLFVWGNCGRCNVLLPITGLGGSEVYETAGAAIQTNVWLKVVITPLLGAIVFALLD